MKIYSVGGAVRDSLLGLPHTDRDYVVVGATPEAMLAQGFMPVGKDFPVFLHPKTHEEYALARAERKSGRGYHGFTFYTAPDVTLEDDLARRDLTVNAMARDEHGTLIDPYGGQRDLAARVLRHVSPAFAEDPLRVLRVARFAARLGFSVAPETTALMRQIVASGELETLPAERLWAETAKALQSPKPSRFLQVLRDCGALRQLMPEVDALYGVPQKPEFHPEIDTGVHVELALDAASRFHLNDAETMFALLCHDLGKALTPAAQLPSHKGHEERGLPPTLSLTARLKPPRDCADAAKLVTRWHGALQDKNALADAETVLAVFRAADALRRPERLNWLIAASFVDRNVYADTPPADPVGDFLRAALQAVKNVGIGEIVKRQPADIGREIEEARRKSLRDFLLSRGS
jgi:tRNA nucleotidyltransferase (CCA-adding enzyme)